MAAARPTPKQRRQRQRRQLAVLSGNFIDEAKKIYGAAVSLYEVPELGRLFAEAFINQWSTDEFLRRFDQTEWAKQRTIAQEAFDILEASDPTEATNLVNTTLASVRTTVGGLGLTLTDEQLTTIAKSAARNKWTGQQFESAVGAEAIRIANQGTTQTPITMQQVKSVAQDYGTPLADADAKRWTDDIASGTRTLEQLVQSQRATAKGLYSAIADRLDTETFTDIVQPYRQIAGQTLEMDPSALNLSDTRWSRLFAPNPENPTEQRMMNLTEWTTFVRSQPEWQNTANAYREYADMADKLTSLFRGRR